MDRVTVAPTTTTARGLSTEAAVGRANGLESGSVVSFDNVVTIPTTALGRQIGVLFPAQERELAHGIRSAFDLE